MDVKAGSHYDASQHVQKNRTGVQTGVLRHASVGNGSEPASSELRIATHHSMNPPLAGQLLVLGFCKFLELCIF